MQSAAAALRVSVPISPMAWLLRLEGVVLLGAALWVYPATGHGWGLFLALLLVPDLSMLGYVAGPRVGAASYNAGHHLIGPALVGLVGWATGSALALAVAAIWVAHVGMDRALGYGLKYPTRFTDTHLGRV